MRTRFQVPSDWDAKAPVALYLPLGEAGDFSHPEALAYIDGEAYAACDRHHQEILLPERWRDGAEHLLALHGWTGLGGWQNGEPGTRLFMRACAVVQIDQPTRDFVTTARVALEIVGELDDNDPVKGRLLNALDRAFRSIDTRDPLGEDTFYDSVPPALERLQADIAAIGGGWDVDVIGVGHAHIDVAWLWTLAQVRHKSSRSFSTVLRLMEQFPEYKFSQSQAQLYKYIEQDHPQIFEGIRQRVQEGRWEVMGGTWVEPDCNAIGAESLARQFLLGRSYFRKHFGDVDTPVLWLPDTFGYTWSLPQLIKEAGMKYFVTHKMSWNQYNHMPHQNLWWQGIDGTRVMTHFLTTPSGDFFLKHSTTYNGVLTPKEIIGTWTNYRQKEGHSELMTAYGYGDGGGGPTREMLENRRRLENHPGAPRVRTGTVREFLDNMEREAGDQLPVWNGEFYLEYHRGTYTSQGRTKYGNRKSEFLLHDAEFLATWASLAGGYEYPQGDLNAAWELVCLNQFHDILPGSSITPVYVDSDRDYAEIRAIGERVRDEAITALGRTVGGEVLAVNPTSFGGRRVGLLPETLGDGALLVDAASGDALPTQLVDGGTLVELAGIQPYAAVALRTGQGTSPAPQGTLSCRQQGDVTVLENDRLRVEIDAAGDITRLLDKTAGREVLPEGERGNLLLFFEDRPMNFDAWDIDIFYEDRHWEAEPAHSLQVIETGPVRAGVEIRRRFRNSQIVQRVYLHREGSRLDFDTWIDWHEQHILLKAAFPVEILNPMATYDIQWGNVERPTHRNTSWDWARFETCAYKWVDLSEGNFGVSLLNDCKHGHDIQDNVMRLTLLKSATSPDPQADQGEHRMTYSLLPHGGDWREGTVAAAYDLNDPLIVRRISGGDSAAPPESLLSVDADNVIIETVKRAEDGQGIIVRMYENERCRSAVTLTAGFPLAEAHRCNLLEENQEKLAVAGSAVTVDVRPYQIITLRLIPRG
jgi:alpha-mannosidase